MENFEFKSQVCTTKEQSERLLALGLKKETADMVYHYQKSRIEAMRWELMPHPPVLRSNCHFNIERLNALKRKNSDGVVMSGEEYFDVLWGKDIPAWSLHRLLYLIPKEVNIDGFKFPLRSDVIMRLEDADFIYERLIGIIERVVKEGYFNKDYLEERK